MISLFRYETPPGPCGYLPGQTWRYEHEVVAALSPAEYEQRLLEGWRRFGHLLFRPVCPACTACRSLRVDVARFRPNRSQRRNRKLNERVVRLAVGRPAVTPEKLDLYDRYHAHQAETKGWPEHGPKDAAEYRDSFVDNPFPVEEWRYTLAGRLIGVGYVDRLPVGLSAIYFVYDPAERERGLGTWNVLCAIDRAAALGLPYVHLGYHVAGSASLAYKANFGPNETLGSDGVWRGFVD
ncbi:MAG TPA: arginyltransferase [Gemmataceae bacterium]|jgi:arginine-tRNA-protein transferase